MIESVTSMCFAIVWVSLRLFSSRQDLSPASRWDGGSSAFPLTTPDGFGWIDGLQKGILQRESSMNPCRYLQGRRTGIIKAFWFYCFSPTRTRKLSAHPWLNSCLNAPHGQWQWQWQQRDLPLKIGCCKGWWLACRKDHPACTGVWGRRNQLCVQNAPWRRLTVRTRPCLCLPACDLPCSSCTVSRLCKNKGFSTNGNQMSIFGALSS